MIRFINLFFGLADKLGRVFFIALYETFRMRPTTFAGIYVLFSIVLILYSIIKSAIAAW